MGGHGLVWLARAAGVAATLLLVAGGDALADDKPPPSFGRPLIDLDSGDTERNPSLSISATELALSGGRGRAAPSSARPRECTVRSWNDDLLSTSRPVRDQLAEVDEMVEGEQYYVECTWLDTNTTDYAEVFTYQPGQAGPSLEAIARRVYDEVPLVFPAPATSPAIDGEQITGLPTWLWIDPAGFQTFDASESLAGITVTVTATPKHVSWDMGDGSDPIVCDAGTPYDPTIDETAQHTDCSHLFQHVSADQDGGVYHASVTTTWAVEWTATGGWGGGTLPDATRTTTFDLTVDQLQAVITDAA